MVGHWDSCRHESQRPSPTCAQVVGTSAFLGMQGGRRRRGGRAAAWQRGYGDYTSEGRWYATGTMRSAFAWTPTAHIRRIRDQAGYTGALCAGGPVALESEADTRVGSRKRGGCARRVSAPAVCTAHHCLVLLSVYTLRNGLASAW